MKTRKTSLDVEEELHFHIDMLERKYTQQGMPALEARAAASRRFGNLENNQKTVRHHKKTQQSASTCHQDILHPYCSCRSRNTHAELRLQGRAHGKRVDHDRRRGPLVALRARLNPSHQKLREA